MNARILDLPTPHPSVEALDAARVYATINLPECCQELLDLGNTGVHGKHLDALYLMLANAGYDTKTLILPMIEGIISRCAVRRIVQDNVPSRDYD